MEAGNRHDAWTDFELELLYAVVNDTDWYGKVCHLIDRSEAAVRARMCALRREAGIVPKPGPSARSPRLSTYQSAAQGSDRLARAIREMAA